MAIQTAVTEKEKRGSGSFFRIKNLVSLVGGIVFVLLFLFLTIVSKNDDGAGLKAGLNGFGLISLVFNAFQYTHYEPGIGSFQVDFPPVVFVLLLFILIFGMGVIVCSILGYVKDKDVKLTGIFSTAATVWCIFLYGFLLSSVNIRAVDFFGVEKKFYQVFSVESGMLILAIAAFLLSAFHFGITEKKIGEMKKYAAIYAMAVFPLSFMFVFFLYPILLQTLMGFKEYTLGGGMNSEWVGFKHFTTIFSSENMLYVIGNTVYISIIKLVISIVFPLVLALLVFDINSKPFRSVSQTIIYIPHFFSWVVVYAISYAFLSPEGVMNTLSKLLGGKAESYLTTPSMVVPIQAIVFGWKEIGWGTIIYYAALSGIDTSMYDAAKVDGAGPLRRLWNISLPSIMPIIVFTMIMALGNILKSAGGEQLLLYNHPAIYKQLLVIDTWIYWEGLTGTGNQLGLGAAMAFFQSFIGIILVLFCNQLSKKLTGRTIW